MTDNINLLSGIILFLCHNSNTEIVEMNTQHCNDPHNLRISESIKEDYNQLGYCSKTIRIHGTRVIIFYDKCNTILTIDGIMEIFFLLFPTLSTLNIVPIFEFENCVWQESGKNMWNLIQQTLYIHTHTHTHTHTQNLSLSPSVHLFWSHVC